MAGSTSGEPVRNHSSVDKVAKRKNTELLADKKKDDWSVNEGDHFARSAASAGNIPQPFNDAEMSRPKRLPELPSGEPSRDSRQHGLAAADDDEDYEDVSLRGW